MHVILQYNDISPVMQWRAFSMRERTEIPFVDAQKKTRNYSLQAEWADWPQPTGRTQLDAANWLI